MGYGVIVLGDAVLCGKRGGEGCARRLFKGTVLHHDDEHASRLRARARCGIGARRDKKGTENERSPQPHLSAGYREVSQAALRRTIGISRSVFLRYPA